AVLHPRIARARLLYRDLLGPRPARPTWRIALGLGLVAGGTVTAFVCGELIASHRWVAPWAPWVSASGAAAVGFGLAPLLGVGVVGLAPLWAVASVPVGSAAAIPAAQGRRSSTSISTCPPGR